MLRLLCLDQTLAMHILDRAKDMVSTAISSTKLGKGKAAEVQNKPHHGLVPGFYQNPWESANDKALPEDFPFSREEEYHDTVKLVEVRRPDFNKDVQDNEMKVTWLGHAGVLVHLPKLTKGAERHITLLIDPIWSERASPLKSSGPIRRHQNPCTLDELPEIDLLFISHNHYDHMDTLALEALMEREPSRTRYCVPLGLKKWFEDYKIPSERIIEMDWWEDSTLSPTTFGLPEELDSAGQIKITCVPAQHASARTGIDKNGSLWSGFVVQQLTDGTQGGAPERSTVYFAGDTGYRGQPGGPVCPAFAEIGERFGQVDFAAIPIWRGGTLSFITKWGVRVSFHLIIPFDWLSCKVAGMTDVRFMVDTWDLSAVPLHQLNPEALTLATHATPEDAACIHKDVRSRASLGIHFATFAGSQDEAILPVTLLEEACHRKDIPTEILEDGGLGVCNVGETVAIPVRSPVLQND